VGDNWPCSSRNSSSRNSSNSSSSNSTGSCMQTAA
jgi:hypothetical protein